MFTDMTNLKIKEAVYVNSVPRLVVKKRLDHLIVTRLSGKCVYYFDDEKIIVCPGESIFLPYGCSYSVQMLSEESRYALLRFTADGEFDKPTKFMVDDVSLFITVFDKLRYSLLFDNKKKTLLSMSHFYELVSFLSSIEEYIYFNSKKLSLIEPVLRYLEEHIYDQNLVIGDLNRLCNISDVYLRKIFLEYTGKSISKYITEKRLEKAKRILDEGDYTLLREVAERVGYSNPLYFSRMFKKRYGYSPSLNINH